jgi:hypothetical protein
MSITIYWACNDESWLRAEALEPIFKDFSKSIKNQKNKIIMCPATKDYMKNIFSVKSIFAYDFKIENKENVNEVVTDKYDQKFFDNHVTVRSKEDKLFSFLQRLCFFTEEKSLLISAGISPFLEDNNITKRCIVIPGTFDIGKWFRQIEFAFYLKQEFNEFKIEENEIFQYVKFHTKEKIIFKQFKVTPEIQKFFDDTEHAKSSRKLKVRLLEDYYLMMKHKKHIIKEIKNNLIKG